MGGDHSHGPSFAGTSGRAAARHKRRLLATVVLLAVFMVVEIGAALATNSLALLSDAGHMLTDVAGLGMALAAIHLADRNRVHPSRTFGLYRLEILAALANAVLLFGVALYVVVEAIRRFDDAPEVLGAPMLVVAVVGLAVNIVAFFLLRDGSKESLNVEGASLEVLADTIGSAGVLLGGVLVAVTGWGWIDPVVGAAIGLWILPRTWRLARQALRILLQFAPGGLDLDALREELVALPGVVDVHDLHVWTLTSDMEVASAHVMVAAGTDSHAVLDDARSLLALHYRITHATLQVEPDDHEGCEEVTW